MIFMLSVPTPYQHQAATNGVGGFVRSGGVRGHDLKNIELEILRDALVT